MSNFFSSRKRTRLLFLFLCAFLVFLLHEIGFGYDSASTKTLHEPISIRKTSWTACTHVVNYGLNFDYGLANFLAFQLKPASALEFGCGIGLYLGYLTERLPWMESAVGIEPSDMSAAGIFGQSGSIPVQITGDILSNSLQATLVAKHDLVYSIEVAEHILPEKQADLVRFLVSKTGKFLVFSAARPGQEGVGHVRDSMHEKEVWIKRFSEHGLHFLPKLSEAVKLACDSKNRNHIRNVFVMGTDPALDDLQVVKVERTPDWDHDSALAKKLFPDVETRLYALKMECMSSGEKKVTNTNKFF